MVQLIYLHLAHTSPSCFCINFVICPVGHFLSFFIAPSLALVVDSASCLTMGVRSAGAQFLWDMFVNRFQEGIPEG